MQRLKELQLNSIYQGKAEEVLQTFPDECVDTIITSPPYWSLRDYKVEGQLGLEDSLEEYLDKLLLITAELKRVLKPSGTLYWVHGNSYSGNMGKRSRWNYHPGVSKERSLEKGTAFEFKPDYDLPPKCLTNQNLRLLLRMTDEQSWIHRNTIIWKKPNPLPSSVKDRLTCSYETVFMFAKQRKYFFDLDPIRAPYTQSGLDRKKRVHAKFGSNKESGGAKLSKGIKSGSEPIFIEPHPHGKNPGDVWTISPANFPEAHFAVYPEALIIPFIQSSCPKQVCSKCGKPRERIIEKIGNSGNDRGEYAKHQKSMKKPANDWDYPSSKTVGWTKCDCGAVFNPGIVLDPFLGSGTTALSALKNGRNFVGVELNPEYIQIAEKRIEPLNQPRLDPFIQEVV